MCPHGYHHNGFMASPALGTQDVRLHIVWKDCIVESPVCSNCEQSAMHDANSERPARGLSTQSTRVLKLPGELI